MQHEEIMGPRLQFVGKFTLYIKPDGTLVVTTGNQRVTVTAEEARELLDWMLLYASRFEAGHKVVKYDPFPISGQTNGIGQ